MIVGCESNNFSIQPINSKLGAYVEEIAELRLSNTEWKVVTKIDLGFLSNEYSSIKQIISLLKNKCNHFNVALKSFFNETNDNKSMYDSLFYCVLPTNQIDIILQEIDEGSHQWFIDEQGHNRKRRAILNILGGVLLGAAGLGFLPENNAKFYMEEFDRLRTINKEQNIYMEKQTILIKSIFNQLNTSEQASQQVTKQINKVFEKLGEHIQKARAEDYLHHKHVQLLHVQNDLGILMDNIILLLTRFHLKQKQFLDAVAITQKNPSNPNLIPPKTLYNALTELKNALSNKGLELPVPLSRKTLSQFYKIATPETAILNNTIIITFSIPLLNAARYTLYKTTSLPYRIKDNLFAYIIPNHEYVALDHFKEKYVAITEDEINKCFQADGNKLICKQTFPILTALSTKTCEINLLRMQGISNECEIRVSNLTSELWIKLRQPNKYIFVFPQNELMIVKCNDATVDKYYSDVGIISYGEDCQIKTNNVEIQAFKTITSESIINFIPSINITINISNEIANMEKLNGFEIPEIKIPQIVNFGEKHKLEEIGRRFDELKSIEQHLLTQTTPFHLKDNISVLSKAFIIIAIITFIITAKIVYKMWLKRRSRACVDQMSKAIFIRDTPNLPLTQTPPSAPRPNTTPSYIPNADPIYPTVLTPRSFPRPHTRNTLISIMEDPNEENRT